MTYNDIITGILLAYVLWNSARQKRAWNFYATQLLRLADCVKRIAEDTRK